MLRKSILVFGGVVLFFWAANNAVFSYGSSSHQALTEQIVEFYNLNFPDNKITDEQLELIIKGVLDEDNGLRSMYHFYDPIYDCGLKCLATNSKDWALGKNGNEFSFDAAIENYKNGKTQDSFIALGHVLHLLEDLAVPEHTRDDSHIYFIKGAQSPYEDYTEKKIGGFGLSGLARKMFDDGQDMIIHKSLDQYFNELASYTNNHFFSEDTIFSEKYLNPKLIKELEIKNGVIYGLGQDEDGTYRLVRIGIRVTRNIVETKYFTVVDEPEHLIINDYFSRLSEKAILSSAGFLRLFQEKIGNNGKNIKGLISEVFSTPSKTPIVSQPNETKEPKSTSTPKPTKTPSPSNSITPKAQKTPEVKEQCNQIEKDNEPLRQIVVNEIAWMGTKSSFSDEWIELYNNTDQSFDLDCWILKSDDNTLMINLKGILGAYEYFLLERTDDFAVSDIKADQIYAGNISNSGQILKLIDNQGNVQDVVGNKENGVVVSWYAGSNETKSTMERKNSVIVGNIKSNWQTNDGIIRNGLDADSNLIAGTPKSKNSNGLTVYEIISGSSSSPSSTSTPSPSVSLTPTPEIEIASPTPSSTPDSLLEPELNVVINEIAWMGTTSSSFDEWIELYNNSESIVDLTGWRIISQDNGLNIDLSSKSIDPFSYFLLERTNDSTVSDIMADQIYVGGLNNEGETLSLFDNQNVLQDKVGQENLNWYAGDNETKSTMERKDSKTRGDVESNWQTNDGIMRNGLDGGNFPINGTPKSKNSFSIDGIKIKNLTVDNSKSEYGGVVLNWTNPTIDNSIASLSFDLRFSYSSIDSQDVWQNNTYKITNSLLPTEFNSGKQTSVSIDLFDPGFKYGATYDTTYYFAIGVTNIGSLSDFSDISNQAIYSIGSAFENSVWPVFGYDSYNTFATNYSGPTTLDLEWNIDLVPLLDSLQISAYAGQPIISSNNSLIMGFGEKTGRLIGIDKNGNLEWVFDNGNSNTIRPSIPIVFPDDRVVYGQPDPGNTIFSADNGNKYWGFLIGDRVESLTLSRQGLIYFTREGSGLYNTGDGLYVLMPDGSLSWKYNASNALLFSQIPVIDEQNVYVGGKAHNGCPIFFSFNGKTGNMNWQSQDNCRQTLVSQSLSMYDNGATRKLYSAAGSYVYEISPDNGEISKFLISSDGLVDSMVSIDKKQGNLLVSFDFSVYNPTSGSAVFCLDQVTKQIKWEFDFPSKIAGKAIIIDNQGFYYFSTKDGQIYSLDSNGLLNWEYESGQKASTHPILGADGELYQAFGSRILKFR